MCYIVPVHGLYFTVWSITDYIFEHAADQGALSGEYPHLQFDIWKIPVGPWTSSVQNLSFSLQVPQRPPTLLRLFGYVT
jgi:hypothetical protein